MSLELNGEAGIEKWVCRFGIHKRMDDSPYASWPHVTTEAKSRHGRGLVLSLERLKRLEI